MNEFVVTKDLRYLQLGNKIVDTYTDISVDIESPNPIFVCEMFKNEFLFSHKQNLFESSDLFKKMKELIYPMMGNNSSHIMEYEVRYGNRLIFESEDKLKIEQLISESWDFVKNKIYEDYPIIIENIFKDAWNATTDFAGKAWDKTKEVAGKAWDATKNVAGKVWDSVKEAGAWILNKGLPWFFDKLEAVLMHPVGIAVDVALTAIGVGKVVTGTLWGALLLWKVYKLISGKSDRKDIWTYVDLVVCLVGVVFSGAAKGIKMAFKAAGGSVAKVGGSVLKTIGSVLGKGAKGIFNLMLKPIEWLASIFGKGAQNLISTFKSSFNGIFDDIAKVFSPAVNKAATKTPSLKTILKKDITNPLRAAANTPGAFTNAAFKGVTTGLAFHGASEALKGGMDWYVSNRRKEQEAQMAQAAASMSDETITSTIDADPEIAAALEQMKSA